MWSWRSTGYYLVKESVGRYVLRLRALRPCAESTRLLDRVERALWGESCEFTGKFVGPTEAAFFLVGERPLLEMAVARIASNEKIPQGQLALEEEPSLSEEDGGPVSRRRPKAFDVWAIPLGGGGFGYFQVLDRHEEFLDLVRVFDAATPTLLPLEQVLNLQLMFPPMFTLVSGKTANANSLRWLGNANVSFRYPTFRHANLAMLYPDRFDTDWSLWTRETGYQFVGSLSAEQLELECLTLWPLQYVAERIKKRIGPRDALARFESGANLASP